MRRDNSQEACVAKPTGGEWASRGASLQECPRQNAGGGLASMRAQCPTCCNLMDYSPPGSSVHGIFQARIVEGVAISSSKGSSKPRDQISVSRVSCSGRRILYHRATWKASWGWGGIKSIYKILSFSPNPWWEAVSVNHPKQLFRKIVGGPLIVLFCAFSMKPVLSNFTLLVVNEPAKPTVTQTLAIYLEPRQGQSLSIAR